MSLSPWKEKIKKHLSQKQIEFIRKTRLQAKAFWFRKDLPQLATLYWTDKWNVHSYASVYQKYFEPFRKKPVRIVEIGVGGFANPNEGGHSLRMWKSYFRRGLIGGIDCYDKRAIEEPRIRTFQGSQTDPVFLEKVVKEMGGIDILVDDGSHFNEHTLESFKILFPLLLPNGIYVVEDTEASYWPGFGGDSLNLNNPRTVMCYFKNLADGLNYAERILPDYQPSYFDRHIVSIHFYHNLIFVFKGLNNEGNPFVKGNNTHIDWILKDYKEGPLYKWTDH